MRWFRSRHALIVSWALASAAMPVCAADLTPPPPPPVFVPPPAVPNPYGILSEVRGGVSAHGIIDHEFGSVDLNAELLSVRPYTLANNSFWNYFIPRIHLGGDFNTAGKTSQVYSGVTWTFPIYQRIFGELTFGGEYNDGHTGLVVPKEYSRVGCNVMFRESGSLGYRLSEHWTVMATLEHSSNAGFCRHNEGITNAGARLGYVF